MSLGDGSVGLSATLIQAEMSIITYKYIKIFYIHS